MTASIVIDIETVPRPASQVELDEWRSKWRPPSNYKDPEKIEAKKQDDEAKWLDKRQFSAAGARIISVAACAVVSGGEIVHSEVSSGDDSGVISNWFRGYLAGFDDYRLITYKGRTFDLPILARTLSDSNVRLKKPVGKWSVIDLFEYPFYRSGGLKYWCKIFGIEFDDSIDGSKVLDLYNNDKWDDIERYNLDDVRITGELYYKLTSLYEL